MSSARAFLVILALAGSSFAAPVAYDDGLYHPPAQFDDGFYHPPAQFDDGFYHPPAQFDDGSWDSSSGTPTVAVPVSTPTTIPALVTLPPIVSTTTLIKLPEPVTTPATVPGTTLIKLPVPVTTRIHTKITSVIAHPTDKPVIVQPTDKPVIVHPTDKPYTTPTSTPTPTGGGNTATGPSGSKKHYTGDGSDWPSIDKWLTFDTLWSLNKDGLSKGCTAGIPQNTPSEIQDLHDGILSESASTKVDSRFILVVIIQESHGCLRVGTTNGGVNNPGIMQSHNGPSDCTKVGSGPCPKEKIVGMIHEGTFGTADGSGLLHGIEWAAKNGAKTEAQKMYWSARLYNSGDNSYKGGDLSTPPVATPEYSSDIVNRLLGFVF